MKRLLMLIVLLLAGCNSEQADKTTKLVPTPTNEITPLAPNQKPKSEQNLLKEKALAEELIQQVNSSGEITDEQAKTLGKAFVYSIE